MKCSTALFLSLAFTISSFARPVQVLSITEDSDRPFYIYVNDPTIENSETWTVLKVNGHFEIYSNTGEFQGRVPIPSEASAGDMIYWYFSRNFVDSDNSWEIIGEVNGNLRIIDDDGTISHNFGHGAIGITFYVDNGMTYLKTRDGTNHYIYRLLSNVVSVREKEQELPAQAEMAVTINRRTLSIKNSGGGNVKIYDIGGRLVQSQTLSDASSSSIILNETLAFGNYVVKVSSADSEFSSLITLY